MLQLKEFIPDVLYAFPYRNEQPGTYVYHKHTFLELSVMLEGYSDYNVEGRWRRVEAGQALLFNPGVHHQETQPAASASLQLHIGFRHVTLPGQIPDHLPFADSLIDLGELEAEFMACARRIVTENQRPAAFGHAVLLQAQVVELLCLLLRALPQNTVSSDYLLLQNGPDTTKEHLALVSAATYYLEAHYGDDLPLSSLAANLHVSAAYLSRTFKAVQGESPINYLTKVRMRRAKALLANGGSVNEVARLVGYQDPYYFSKLFKRYFGVAPSRVGK